MVFFRVTENINIKTTDGSLVKYTKLRNPSNLLNNSIYVSTYEEVERLNAIFEKVGPNFKSKIVLEKKVSSNKTFPIELGISNKYEYKSIKAFQSKIEQNEFVAFNFKDEIKSLFLNEKAISLDLQLKKCDKKDIKVAIIGNVGESIGEIVSGLTALRIFKEYLNKKFQSVQLDLYLEAAENKFYSRDKEILETQKYLGNINPLAIDVRTLCEYDFYIDNSLVKQRSYYKELPYVDAYLHKFGIDYNKIASENKNNSLDITNLKVNQTLKEKIEKLKSSKTKLLFFHPFTAKINCSIPKEIAYNFLKKLIKKHEDYTIVTAVKMNDFKEDGYVNLGANSKTISDFIYIVSAMDKIITADTSTYHIADAFFIPTVVIFTINESKNKIKYFTQTRAIKIEDQSKNLSKFKFDDSALVLYKFESWNSLKVSKVIKLLETI